MKILRVAKGDKGEFGPLTMPFGLTGTPEYFQHFIHNILLARIGKDTTVYLDDIMANIKKLVDQK